MRLSYYYLTVPKAFNFKKKNDEINDTTGKKSLKANWKHFACVAVVMFFFNGLAFSQAPIITANPLNRSICVGGSTTYSVSASNATTYQWQVDTGSGYVNIANGGTYSGALTATLTITGVTPGMTGNLYRCIVSGTESPDAASNGGMLTVSDITANTYFNNISCNGGSNGTASVVASGGIGGYFYSWSPSGGTAATATGLAAGAYTCTITDWIGCTLTKNFTITQPSALASASAQTNVYCNGGSNGAAAVNASGGAGAYTYSWSPSGGTASIATGLAAGSYRCTITDANFCSITKNFSITQPSQLASTGSQTNVSCNGGSNGTASITVSGGTPAYTYSWSPSGGTAATATGLLAGAYTCTVTDANGCTLIRNFNINQPSQLASTGSQTNVSCYGGSNGTATVTVSGGSGGYTYSWSPSGGTGATASGLPVGTYTCTITDANYCQITKSFTITQPPVLVAGFSQTNIACNGGSNGTASVTASGGTGSYTYLWSMGGTDASVSGLVAGAYTCTITDANSCTITKNITITQPSVLLSTGSQTNVSCNGGSNGTASITVSGGTPAYTYSWSPSGGTAATATGLLAGAYTCTVTDANGCTLIRNFNITQPSQLTSTGSQTNVSCYGGSNGTATVTVSGGSGGYTYSWSPSGGTGATASGLSVGNYTCTVTDANYCQITRSFTITQPATLVAGTSQMNVSCNGGSNGSATVNVTGGAGGYTYSWSPSGGTGATASGLSVGNYTCTVTDANYCQIIKSITITQPATLVAGTSQMNVSCNGGSNGSATVNVTGGAGEYTYSWSPSGGTGATASGLSVGNYTCTVTDTNGCTLVKNFTLNQPTALVATTSQVGVSCNGGSNGTATVTVSGGTPNYSYSWAPSGGTAATATGLLAGVYTCTITDANACTLAKTFTITQPSALVASSSKVDVSCNGGSNGSATVNVTGGAGGYTYSWSPTGGTAATASGLPVGTYTCTITDANGCTLVKNFTLNQPTALVATTSQVGVSCNGGSNGTATVTVSGGTPNYSYSWAPSGGTAATATGLLVGVYTCTITDANACTLVKTFTITQPSALVASSSKVDVSCNGGSNGSATVNITGGAGGYTYSWSPTGGTAATASGLSVGNYTCTITDANGCTLVKNFTLNQPTALVATTSQVGVSCNGGSNGTATVTVSGGTPNYSYSWAPSGGTAATATGLLAGVYTCTITDANACTLVKTFTITQPSALVASSSKVDVSCNGGSNGSATVNVTGGAGGYTYSWSPTGGTAATASGLPVGNYTCTITDANGCTLVKNFTIIQPSALTATTSHFNVSTAEATDGSASVTVNGGTAPYSYSWAPYGGTGATATGLSAGSYTCTITDLYGCTKSVTFSILEPAILADFSFPVKQYGDVPFEITDPESNSNAAFSYSASNPEVAKIDGNTITIIKPGTTIITATQAANSGHLSNSITATLTVAPKDITATIHAVTDLSKVYDGNTSFSLQPADYQLTGLIDADEVGVSGTAQFDSKEAGEEKTITINNLILSGAQKDYYHLTTESVEIAGVILKKAITASAVAISKTYDGTNVAAVDFHAFTHEDGLVGDDELQVQFASAKYDTKNAGTEKVVNLSGLQLTGADKDNYTLNEIGLHGSILPKNIAINAKEGQGKVYGDADPALLYNVSPALINGDTFTGSLKREAGKNTGEYAIEIGSLSAGLNYKVSDYTPATFTITPAPLSVKPDDKTRKQGEANPEFTFSYTGFKGGDMPSDLKTQAQAQTAAIKTSPIGYYDIIASAASSSNYTITFVPGKLSVLPSTVNYVKGYTSSTSVLQIRVYTEEAQQSVITLYTFAGKMVRTFEKHLQVGINSYTMDISNLSAGIYMLSVNGQNFKEGQRIMIK